MARAMIMTLAATRRYEIPVWGATHHNFVLKSNITSNTNTNTDGAYTIKVPTW